MRDMQVGNVEYALSWVQIGEQLVFRSNAD